MKNLLYKGSTKDIFHVSGEELLFKFSDRYSIFDYGEMPDQINNKGKNTAKFTVGLYRKLENKNIIKTHLLKNGESSDEIVVRKFTVPRDFDSSVFYQKRPINSFIPLEVIFRFGVPVGSSLINRGYKAGEVFEFPLIEFTTKLESIDRLITDEEAKKLAGMNDFEFNLLLEKAKQCATFLKTIIDGKGLKLWDGKFEFAFGELDENSNRELILVDSISLDELRITYKDIPLSKEILRQAYKHTEWYNELVQAKSVSKDNFRAYISKPKTLDANLITLISEMYEEVQAVIISDSLELNKLDAIVGELKNEYNYIW
jgi:phosphoribosylaminoimidazole-succinocarboxamide synthase